MNKTLHVQDKSGQKREKIDKGWSGVPWMIIIISFFSYYVEITDKLV